MTGLASDQEHDLDVEDGHAAPQLDEDPDAAGDAARWAPMNDRALRAEVDGAHRRSQPETAMDRATAGAGGEVPHRGEMEKSFGTDFSSVRAHLGVAAPLAGMDAVAAARGEEVAFASSSPSKGVVAHELAHVMQHRGAGGGAAVAQLAAVEPTGGAAEREADTVAGAVARGEAAPAIRAAPEAAIGRVYGDFDNMPDDALGSPPPTPSVASPSNATAGEWLDHHASALAPLVQQHIAAAHASTGHPRLHWLRGAGPVAEHVWQLIVRGDTLPGSFSKRLIRAADGRDLEGRVDATRIISSRDDERPRRGPLDWTPEVVHAVAHEIERAIAASIARLGPRVVAAVDAAPEEPVSRAGDTDDGRDAAAATPDSIVPSHPIDPLVSDALCTPGVATVQHLPPGEADPFLDAAAVAGTGGMRPISYEWVEDERMWNWVRVDPLDATPEEVAHGILGEPTRAWELRSSPPFFALPTSAVELLSPGRNQPAIDKMASGRIGDYYDGMFEFVAGTDEAAVLESSVADEAALAQAARVSSGGSDAGALADRCRAQLTYLGTEYAQFGAADLLAPLRSRLDNRAMLLSGVSPDDYVRYAALFEAQAQVLFEVAGDLEPLAVQAARIQAAEAQRAATDPTADPNPGIDPGILELAERFLKAGAIADLPESARARLAAARAEQESVVFDAFDAMLGDARSRTESTMPLAEKHGPALPADGLDTGTEVALDLRTREAALSADVLRARRAQEAGTLTSQDTQVLGEKVRALQVESRLTSNMTHCDYLAKKLREELGLVAFFSMQYEDIEAAANRLSWLKGRMSEVLVEWRAEHAKLFAAIDAGCCEEPDPAAAARAAIDNLEERLRALGDDTVKKALDRAYEELEDIAVARIVFDIALMVGLTVFTGGLGSMAAGAMRGLRMGRLVVALADISTQSVAMAGLRSAIYGDSFVDSLGTELITNFAGFAALRGLAHALPKTRFARRMAALREADGGLKYVAHATELTVEAATMAGLQFAMAEAESLIRSGRTLNDEELKNLAIQGIGMFIGNAVAHRLTAKHMDQLQAYATKLGVRFRRQQVENLAKQVQLAGDPELARELLRQDRELLQEELELYLMAEADPAERLNMGEETFNSLRTQTETQLHDVQGMTVEYSLGGSLDEIAPGKAWEGPSERVEPVLDEAKAAGAILEAPQLTGDGTLVHVIRVGERRYTIHEQAPRPRTGNDPAAIAVNEARQRLAEVEGLPHSGIDGAARSEHRTMLAEARSEAGRKGAAGPTEVLIELEGKLPEAARGGLVAFRANLKDDTKVLDILEKEVGKRDLVKFLTEKVRLTPAERKKLNADLFTARRDLTVARLEELGILDDTGVVGRATHEANIIVDKLVADGTLDQAAFDALVSSHLVGELVGEMGEAVSRRQLREQLTPQQRIVSNLEIVREDFTYPRARTIDEWRRAAKAANQDDDVGGLYEADRSIWKSVTEIDNMIVEPMPDGRLRPVLLEQVKAGHADSAKAATEQNNKAIQRMVEIRDGATDLRLYDRVGKNQLGAQRTADFDLTAVDTATTQTRGLPGKPVGSGDNLFSGALDLGPVRITAEDMRKVLESIAREQIARRAQRRLETLAANAPGGNTADTQRGGE